MKIMWLSHFFPYPPKGGMLQRSHNLIKQIAKKHDVHLISLYQKKLLPTNKALNEAIRALENMCYRIDTFPIKSDKSKWHWATMTLLSYFSGFPYDVNWLKNDEMMSFVKDVAKRDNFDLIHLDTSGLFPYALHFSNIPFVLTHHNIESDMMSRRYEHETMTLKRIYFRNETEKLREYERKICSRCAMNLVVSDLDAVRLKEIAGDVNITVIPNGVDVEYFRPSVPIGNDDGGLVFAGGMNVYSNHEAVLFFLSKIWPILREDNPNRPVTIIGRNPPKELLTAARDSKIFAPGFVEDVRPYIDSAKIYICPITNGGGTRLKILDALAMGKPLVATGFAVEGLELVEEEHYLRAETAPEFVAQIKRLDNDHHLCKKIALAGRRFVANRYSWEIIGEKLGEAYRKAAIT